MNVDLGCQLSRSGLRLQLKKIIASAENRTGNLLSGSPAPYPVSYAGCRWKPIILRRLFVQVNPTDNNVTVFQIGL